MIPAFHSNIGAFIDPRVGVKPQANTGSTVNGPAINRAVLGGKLFSSCVLHLALGTETLGGASAPLHDCKLQDSADGSTGWADLTGAAVAQQNTGDVDVKVNVDLLGAKRFIRAVQTSAFTGGSPTIDVAAVVVLGGADTLVT